MARADADPQIFSPTRQPAHAGNTNLLCTGASFVDLSLFLLAISVLLLTPRPPDKAALSHQKRALELLPHWSFACSEREAHFASSSSPFLSDQSWLARATLNPTLQARCQTLQCRAICGRG